MISALLWLVFSTGGIEISRAPSSCTAMLDAGLIQVKPGKIPRYCISPKGYAKVVRL